ncbi:hypothetical protein ANCDUO_21523, partial [Ancylostoma duodenale]
MIDTFLKSKAASISSITYKGDRTKNAQFVVISLRNNMFELGDRLVGIYKIFLENRLNVKIDTQLAQTFDRTQSVVIDPPQVQSVQEECARRDQEVLTKSCSASDEEMDDVDDISSMIKESQRRRSRSFSRGDNKEVLFIVDTHLIGIGCLGCRSARGYLLLRKIVKLTLL